jgi:diguanylate cyclase (GGDEF)-like protein
LVIENRPHRPYRSELRFRTRAGDYHCLYTVAGWAPSEDGEPHVLIGISSDITERREAEEALKHSERNFRELIETVRLIPWRAHAQTSQFTYVGPQAEAILGYPPSAWYEEDFWPSKIHPDDRQRAVDYCLSFQAAHDDLANLVNRREFESRLALALERARARQVPGALLYLDLDQFKIVNDTCGHADGDQLLRLLARAYLRHVRERDTLARLGGDEFALLVERCSIEEAAAVANKLLQTTRDFRLRAAAAPERSDRRFHLAGALPARGRALRPVAGDRSLGPAPSRSTAPSSAP